MVIAAFLGSRAAVDAFGEIVRHLMGEDLAMSCIALFRSNSVTSRPLASPLGDAPANEGFCSITLAKVPLAS